VEEDEEAYRVWVFGEVEFWGWEYLIEDVAVQIHCGLNERPSKTLSVSCWNMRRVSIKLVNWRAFENDLRKVGRKMEMWRTSATIRKG
jgi:hypothetical protein